MQDFHVVRCYSCSKFQVHIVRKDCKFLCKVCNAKQSVKKNYGRGTAKDCRSHVQKLNTILITSEEAPFAALNGNLLPSNQQHNHDDSYEFYEDTDLQKNECSFSLLSDDYVNDSGQYSSSGKHNKYIEHLVLDSNVKKTSDLSHNSGFICNSVSSNYSQANVKHCLDSVSTSYITTPKEESSTFGSLITNHRSENDRRSGFKHRLDESVNTPSPSDITEIHGREKSPLLSGCFSGCNSLKASKISNYCSDSGNAAQPTAKRKASGSLVSEYLNIKTMKPQDKEMDTSKTHGSKNRMLSKLSFFDDINI